MVKRYKECDVKDELILHHNGSPSGYNESVIHSNGTKDDNYIPRIKDIIGRAVPRIGSYKSLDNTKQVVALIDDVSCFSIAVCIGQQYLKNIYIIILWIFTVIEFIVN